MKPIAVVGCHPTLVEYEIDGGFLIQMLAVEGGQRHGGFRASYGCFRRSVQSSGIERIQA